jgi:uncharacterized protein (TIGR03435 family)
MTRLALAILAGATLVSANPLAQQPASETPKFDAVSIRRSTSSRGFSSSGAQPAGRYFATSVTPINLIRNAYGLESFQVVEPYPGWLSSERFDVNAVSEAGLRGGRLEPMLQAMLAERFRLVAHKETRTLPSYVLVRSRDDGRLGPQLKPWTIDCDALRAAGQTPPVSTTLADLLKVRPCARSGGSGLFAAGGEPIEALVTSLKSTLNAPVLDDTGLEGKFEILLRWNDGNLPSLSDPELPSTVFLALQEQLGLKLEPRRSPIEVLVIDAVERPTEN